VLPFSIVYWVFLVLTLPVFYIPAVVIWLVTLPFDRRRVVLHYYTCFWGAFYIYTNPFWKVRVTGREKLPWRKPVIIVSNHASLIDIIVLFALYRPYKWVSKAENFKLPFIGWNMTMNGYVRLVRGERASVIAMMDRCRHYLGHGSSLLMFPEGTRSDTGELREFKAGAFQLAMETGCPVVPVAVWGTAKSLPKHGLVLRDSMDARVEVLDPIDPTDFESLEALRDAARAAIRDALLDPEPRLDEAI
jgi:1-acyl-sn-glycerol-3-phosphate acyltransferase